ncbi:hypothetical protein VRRI112168_08265 [Vreelandella rituensis]
MNNATVTFPTIWDQPTAQGTARKPFIRRLWKGLMKLSEVQGQAQARRGFDPYV